MGREEGVPRGRSPLLEAVEDPRGVAEVTALGVEVDEGVPDGSGEADPMLDDAGMDGLAGVGEGVPQRRFVEQVAGVN